MRALQRLYSAYQQGSINSRQRLLQEVIQQLQEQFQGSGAEQTNLPQPPGELGQCQQRGT